MAPENPDEVRKRIASLYDQAENATGNFNATRAMAARTRSRGVPLAKRAGRRPDPGLDEVARQWFDTARAKLGPTVPAVLPTDRLPEPPLPAGRSWNPLGALRGSGGDEREVRALPATAEAPALPSGERQALPAAQRPEALESGARAVAELPAGSPASPASPSDPTSRQVPFPDGGMTAPPRSPGLERAGHAMELPGTGTAEPGGWGAPQAAEPSGWGAPEAVNPAALSTAPGVVAPPTTARAWAEPPVQGATPPPVQVATGIPPQATTGFPAATVPGIAGPQATTGILAQAATVAPAPAPAPMAVYAPAGVPMGTPVETATAAPVQVALGIPAQAGTAVPGRAVMEAPAPAVTGALPQVVPEAPVQSPRELPGTAVPGRLSPTVSKSGARWKLQRARDLLSTRTGAAGLPGTVVQPTAPSPPVTAVPVTGVGSAATALPADTGSFTTLTDTGSYAFPAPTPVTTTAAGPLPLPLPMPAPESPRALRAAKAVAFAREQIGKPCVWGAMGPGSYDCSSLTQAAWRAAGVTLPRAAHEQALAGTPVTLDGAEPGDLVLFFDDDRHVGLYVGEGMMVHAPGPGSSIGEESVYGAGAAAIHRIVRPA